MKNLKPKTTKTKRQSKNTDIQFILANERTLLAWIRTGLTLIAGGVAISFLAAESNYATLTGFGAIIAGGLIAMAGYMRYTSADEAVRKGKVPSIGHSGLWVVIGVCVFAIILITVKTIG
jgi:putative membrane protein